VVALSLVLQHYREPAGQARRQMVRGPQVFIRLVGTQTARHVLPLRKPTHSKIMRNTADPGRSGQHILALRSHLKKALCLEYWAFARFQITRLWLHYDILACRSSPQSELLIRQDVRRKTLLPREGSIKLRLQGVFEPRLCRCRNSVLKACSLHVKPRTIGEALPAKTSGDVYLDSENFMATAADWLRPNYTSKHETREWPGMMGQFRQTCC